MLSCSIWFSAPSFWMGGGLESRCVGRVYGADGAVRLCFGYIRPSSGALGIELQHIDFCTEFLVCTVRIVHSTIRTVHTTYAAALKTTTHPKPRCRKPYAATQHLMLLMMDVCTRNMSS